MLRTLRKPILSAAGLAVAAASLAVALPCSDALAAESVVKVSPAQTELIQSNLFIQNTQPAKAVMESIPSDWKKSTLSAGRQPSAKTGSAHRAPRPSKCGTTRSVKLMAAEYLQG